VVADGADVVPIEALALPQVQPGRSPLEAGISLYQRLVRDQSPGEPPLDALASVTAPPAPAPGLDADRVVPIRSLCYSGRAALQRASELRALIGSRLASGDMDTVRPLVQELLDLVPLALDDAG
jgi:hypothetical protein